MAGEQIDAVADLRVRIRTGSPRAPFPKKGELNDTSTPTEERP